MTQDGWDERGDLTNRNKVERKFRKQGDKGGRETGIDVHVGIQKRGLNAELNDVTEAHGDFRLFVETFHQ